MPPEVVVRPPSRPLPDSSPSRNGPTNAHASKGCWPPDIHHGSRQQSLHQHRLLSGRAAIHQWKSLHSYYPHLEPPSPPTLPGQSVGCDCIRLFLGTMMPLRA